MKRKHFVVNNQVCRRFCSAIEVKNHLVSIRRVAGCKKPRDLWLLLTKGGLENQATLELVDRE